MKMRGTRKLKVLTAMVAASGLFVTGFGGTARAGAATAAAVQLQDAFSSAAEAAFPAVVVIVNKRIARTPLYPQLPPEFRFFFGIPEHDQPQPGQPGRPGQPGEQETRKVPQPVGKGSGVIIRSDGFIVTNYHVIADNDALEVKLEDGRTFDSSRDKDAVKLVGADKETDLAVLQIGAGKLTLADLNEESANLLALQTRQQLAINSLGLAAQAEQSVLALFG